VRKMGLHFVTGPFRMVLFPKLWNAGYYRLGNVSW
jgi:hypothetical protein